MDKKQIIATLITALENDLHKLHNANQQASAGATHTETRAETKWDTCGLEASYLARGHAEQYKKLTAQIHQLRNLTPAPFTDRPIASGALIKTELNGQILHLLILPHGGGKDLQINHTQITIITPQSPIGTALLHKKPTDTFTLPTGTHGRIISVQ